jgi:hypothetical protein
MNLILLTGAAAAGSSTFFPLASTLLSTVVYEKASYIPYMTELTKASLVTLPLPV